MAEKYRVIQKTCPDEDSIESVDEEQLISSEAVAPTENYPAQNKQIVYPSDIKLLRRIETEVLPN